MRLSPIPQIGYPFGAMALFFLHQYPPSIGNAAAYADNAHFVPALRQPVLDLLQPQSGERILDLGCGDGAIIQESLLESKPIRRFAVSQKLAAPSLA